MGREGIVFLQLARPGESRKLQRYHQDTQGSKENSGPIRGNRSFAFDLSKVKDFTQGILVISIRMN